MRICILGRGLNENGKVKALSQHGVRALVGLVWHSTQASCIAIWM